MSTSSMLEFVSQQLPTVYKTLETGSSGGQKVVCTPEVSLYQYGSEGAPNMGMRRMEEKAHSDLNLPSTVGRVSELGGNGETGSNSSTSGFQCGFCGKTFQQKNTFQNHLRSHREGEDPYQCDICGKTFAVPARLTRHYRTHTGEKPYQCEYCNKSFSVKENLSVHRRIHTKERPYKCEVCERAFEHSGKLHRHMRIHTGERPHRCQICQKTFIQSGQLVIHMRTHTGEKPYVCKVCNKGFTCSKQLKVHTRTHTGEKPYQCDICGKSFGYNHVLKLHQVAHFGEKVYKCTICNGTFTSKKSLESHIKTHSEGSVPTESSSHSVVEPSVPSPSSLSQTPQNSDKENRESSSDSEISSQNSPHNLESPKTPPSPVFTDHLKPQSIPHGNYQRGPISTFMNRDFKGANNGNSNKNSLPYPMLPPTVQVHQNPQSRTTFLYVTSKLPVPLSGSASPSSGISRSNSPPSRHFSGITSPNNAKTSTAYMSSVSPNNNNFKGFNGLLSNTIDNVLTNKGTEEPPAHRDKMFLANASIRDKKVLPFLEQFGYGLPKDINSVSQNLNRKGEIDFQRDMVTVHPIRENIPNGNMRNLRCSPNRQHHDEDQFSHFDEESRRSRSRSPEPVEHKTGYTPGGVLALALTRGSKAVMQSTQFSTNFKQISHHSLTPRSQPESPESGLDFSFHNRRSSSPSRNSLVSLTPPSTSPGSTPGPDDYVDDSSSSRGEDEPNNNEIIKGGNRRRSSASGGGPRKRSSLILEKYAQENPASPATPVNQDSILSQRLRLSSVIQYAEKCS